MEETAAATGVSIPAGVLVRLEDTAALFRCAVTCRQWSRLVSDASFLRRCWPEDEAACRRWSTFLAGFFTLKRLDRTDPAFVPGEVTFATIFVPTPRSAFGPSPRSLSSFFPDTDPCLFEDAVPLTARRGLLLVRIAVHGDFGYHYRLVMCNLLAGKWDVLPLLSGALNFSKSGYAILTSADCSLEQQPLLSSPGYSTFFKVLILGTMYDVLYPYLYVFSSKEATWSKPRKISFGHYGQIGDCIHPPDAVVSRGKVHWKVGSWSVDVDAETNHISRIMITPSSSYSPTYDEPQLTVTANGTLSVLLLSRPGLRLEIYTRQDEKKSDDGGTTEWLGAGSTTLKPSGRMKRGPRPICLSLLGEKSGTMLLKDSQKQIYMADLETGVTEELTDCLDGLNRRKIILLEMDWSALFISRLSRW